VEPARAAIVLIGSILGCIATAVGIVTSLKGHKSQSRADNEKERSGAVDALQITVSRQQEVIAGLAQGLKDCITRDNESRTHQG